MIQDLKTSLQNKHVKFSKKNRSSGPELIGWTLDIHMTKSVIGGFYIHMWT